MKKQDKKTLSSNVDEEKKKVGLFYKSMGALGKFLMKKVWGSTEIYYKERFPSQGNVVCVCNHYSCIDADAIYSRLFNFEGRIVVKADSLKNGFVRKSLEQICDPIPVQREESDIGAMKAMLRELQSGGKVLIFPEGKCNKGKDFKTLFPLKEGFASVAAKTGALVVPAVYYRPLRPMDFKHNKLIIGNPIDMKKYIGKKFAEVRDEITQTVRNAMESLRVQIDEIVEKFGGNLKKYEAAKSAPVLSV